MSAPEDIVDKQALVDYTNDKFFLNKISDLDFADCASLYWLYQNTVSLWNSQVVRELESRIISLLQTEIQI